MNLYEIYMKITIEDLSFLWQSNCIISLCKALFVTLIHSLFLFLNLVFYSLLMIILFLCTMFIAISTACSFCMLFNSDSYSVYSGMEVGPSFGWHRKVLEHDQHHLFALHTILIVTLIRKVVGATKVKPPQ